MALHPTLAFYLSYTFYFVVVPYMSQDYSNTLLLHSTRFRLNVHTSV